ncbi:MAG: hypothetical protein R2877_05235 [Bdellovibrionota bacterium]
MKKILFMSMLFLLASCEDDENRFFQLGEFRVLAVQADFPEIDGNSPTPITVTLTPFVSDVKAAGRTLSIDILACPDPGLQLGNEPTCDESLSTTQTIAYANVNSSTLGARFTGAMPSFTVDVPPGLLTGQTAQTQFNGLDYLITMKFSAGSESTSTYKRITVSQRTPKNKNPRIENVLRNGNTGGSIHNNDSLGIDLLAGFGAQTYEFRDQDGIISEKNEELTTSWFTYKGTTDLRRTFINEETVFEQTPNTNNPFVVAVLRDDRGGIDVVLRE